MPASYTLRVSAGVTSSVRVASGTATITDAGRMTSDSIPANTVNWDRKHTLSGGNVSYDLTNLPASQNVDMTGLRVRMIAIQPDAANTSPIVIGPNATDGYPIFGVANDVSLGGDPDGLLETLIQKANRPVVSGILKVIQITSIQADAAFDIIIVAGPDPV